MRENANILAIVFNMIVIQLLSFLINRAKKKQDQLGGYYYSEEEVGQLGEKRLCLLYNKGTPVGSVSGRPLI